jgi:hypothetical protein
MTFGITDWDELNKLPIVGDAKWVEWTATVANAIVHSAVRYFPVREQTETLKLAKDA